MDWESERLEIRENVGRYVNDAYEKSMREISDEARQSRSRWLYEQRTRGMLSKEYPVVPPPPPQRRQEEEEEQHSLKKKNIYLNGRRERISYAPPREAPSTIGMHSEELLFEDVQNEFGELRQEISTAFIDARSDAQKAKERIELLGVAISRLEEKSISIDQEKLPRIERSARQVSRQIEELTETVTNIRRNFSTRAANDETSFRKLREHVSQLRDAIEIRPTTQAMENIAQEKMRSWLQHDPSVKDLAQSQARRAMREILLGETDLANKLLHTSHKKEQDTILAQIHQELNEYINTNQNNFFERIATKTTAIIRNTTDDIMTAAAVAAVASRIEEISAHFRSLTTQFEQKMLTNSERDRQLANSQLETHLLQCEQRLAERIQEDQFNKEKDLKSILSETEIVQLKNRLIKLEEAQQSFSKIPSTTSLITIIEERIATELMSSRRKLEQELRQDQDAMQILIQKLKNQLERQVHTIDELKDIVQNSQQQQTLPKHCQVEQNELNNLRHEFAQIHHILDTRSAELKQVRTEISMLSQSHNQGISEIEQRWKSEISSIRQSLEEQRLAELEDKDFSLQLNTMKKEFNGQLEEIRTQMNENDKQNEESRLELRKALEISEKQLKEMQRRLADQTKSAALASVKAADLERRLRRNSTGNAKLSSPTTGGNKFTTTINDENSFSSSIDTEETRESQNNESKNNEMINILSEAQPIQSEFDVLSGNQKKMAGINEDPSFPISQQAKKIELEREVSTNNNDDQDVAVSSSGNTTSQCQFCMRRMPRREMPAHVANECKLAIVECSDCGERVRRWNLAQHQRVSCPGPRGERESEERENIIDRPLSYSSDDTFSNDIPKTPPRSSTSLGTPPKMNTDTSFTSGSNTPKNNKSARSRSSSPSSRIGGALFSSLRVRGSKKNDSLASPPATISTDQKRLYTFDTFAPSGPTSRDDRLPSNFDASVWSSSQAADYVSKHLSVSPRVPDLIRKHNVDGTKLIHMTEPDLLAPEPHGLGLSSTEAGELMSLVQELILLRAQTRDRALTSLHY
uniref:TRAF-type domain-containing protein n=1 Tax=Aureoumbra lagunensis TaxID=44058 RepID=A0A7S3NJH2_9STRA